MVEKKLAPKEKTVVSAKSAGNDKLAPRDGKKAVAKKNDKNKKPNIFKRIGRFFKECYSELKKVTWPTGKEWLSYCIAVLTFLVIMAVVVGVFDFGMSELLQLIVG